MSSSWSIVAAAAGAAGARAAIEIYFERKRARTEIELVPDGRGGFIDKATIFERRMFWAWLVLVISVSVLGYLAVVYS